MKKCSKCKNKKELSEFHKHSYKTDGLYNQCKECVKHRNKERYNRDRENRLIQNYIYYRKNRQKIIEVNIEYEKKRSHIDPLYRLRKKLRSRLRTALKNDYKSGSAVADLGCSIEFLKTYLESQFLPGMTWDNYNKSGWNIDHIIPLSKFDLTNREELLKACHYTNLQPMWAIDNIKKGNKVCQ